jgi:hypothetical protein
MDLNKDQFLYHGTTADIKGDKILPAKVHGGHSNWGEAGSEWGEPSHDHAWTHPDEKTVWGIAHDRVIHAGIETGSAPRARVYAVRPNEHTTPGSGGVQGEFKAPHFDIDHVIDTMPGRQGTFPEINWNDHAKTMSKFSEDEDANHPHNNSVAFGHENRWDGDHWNGRLRRHAETEDLHHYMQRLDDRNIKPKFESKPDTLPGMMNKEQFVPRRGR